MLLAVCVPETVLCQLVRMADYYEGSKCFTGNLLKVETEVHLVSGGLDPFCYLRTGHLLYKNISHFALVYTTSADVNSSIRWETQDSLGM